MVVKLLLKMRSHEILGIHALIHPPKHEGRSHMGVEMLPLLLLLLLLMLEPEMFHLVLLLKLSME